MRSSLRFPSLLVAVALAAAPAVAATPASEASIGADGSVLRLVAGRHSALFAGSDDPSEVLVLDVTSPSGEVVRHLVPGTESASAEASARMVYEPSSGTAYLLWEGMVSGIHPALFLTSFGGGGFADLIEIVSGLFNRKGSPDLVVTRDVHVDDAGVRHGRTVMHLSWWNEAPDATRKLYAQVILDDGVYLGWTPVTDLSHLVGAIDPSLETASAGVVDALRIRPGADHRTVVLGFLDPDSQKVVTVRAELHARALTDFGDKARLQIIGIGQRAKSRSELAELSAAAVREAGAGFHPSALEYIAAGVEELVSTSTHPLDPDGLAEIADAARLQIIGIGARIRRGGLADSGDARFLAIGETPYDDGIRHLIEVAVVGSWDAPEVGGHASLYVSPSGERALVAWLDGDRVLFRETRDGGWSEVSGVDVGDGLDVAEIHRLLATRVGDR